MLNMLIKTPLGGNIRGGSRPTGGGMNGHCCPTNLDVIPRTWASSIERQERLGAEKPAYFSLLRVACSSLCLRLSAVHKLIVRREALMASFSAGTRDEMERYLNCYITEISNLRRRGVAMATSIVMDMNADTRLESMARMRGSS